MIQYKIKRLIERIVYYFEDLEVIKVLQIVNRLTAQLIWGSYTLGIVSFVIVMSYILVYQDIDTITSTYYNILHVGVIGTICWLCSLFFIISGMYFIWIEIVFPAIGLLGYFAASIADHTTIIPFGLSLPMFHLSILGALMVLGYMCWGRVLFLRDNPKFDFHAD